MAVVIVLDDEQQDQPVDTTRWTAFSTAVLDHLQLGNEVELSIRFVDEPTIEELNEHFLAHVGPTDVLSFPIEDDFTFAGSEFAGAESAPLLLGDIVICPNVAAKQAPSHDTTYEAELALLITHGILHLIGMDHEVDEEAEVMEQRERDILALCFTPTS